ncbi:MAG: lipoprotein insertase outer membrane protein LolB [Pseudomonadota bacterium]
MKLFSLIKTRVSALSCVLMLSACASIPQTSEPIGPPEPAAGNVEPGWLSQSEPFVVNRQLSEVDWRYSAKVGLTTDSLREQANLVWQYADQKNSIRLFGPLGVGAIKIEFDEAGVQLSDNKGVLHRGSSAQQLLTDIVGWPLPIDALSHWLFVQPDLALPYQYRLNEEGQVASIRQLGWQIDYSNYRQYDDQFLPRKLSAYKQFASSEQGAVSVKLITKSWQW